MSDRCILAVRFTPAGPVGMVGKAVGGFLRYVQHRDLHLAQDAAADPQVRGLLKYVAHRDQASARAELFGPAGTIGSAERRQFAAVVERSLGESRPQLYRNRQGEMVDRRRAVYRMFISPERAEGLDLRRLTGSTVSRLESEMGASGLQWIAAIHRNTKHLHVHLVLAGMYEAKDGWHRVDLTRPRLAAIKQALALEIERQRGDRKPAAQVIQIPARTPRAPLAQVGSALYAPTFRRPVGGFHATADRGSLLQLRAIGRRYRWQMQRAAAEEARRRGWEYAA